MVEGIIGEIINYGAENPEAVIGYFGGIASTIACTIAGSYGKRKLQQRDDKKENIQGWYRTAKTNAENIEEAVIVFSSGTDLQDRKEKIDTAVEGLKELSTSDVSPRNKKIHNHLQAVLNTYDTRQRNYDPADPVKEFFTPSFLKDMNLNVSLLRSEAESRLRS